MLVFEQFDQGMPAEESPENLAPQDPLAEITPLKKYYLSQRLIEIKNRLYKYGIQQNDLDFILRFQNELSYDVLLILSDSIISNIEQKIAEIQNEKQ